MFWPKLGFLVNFLAKTWIFGQFFWSKLGFLVNFFGQNLDFWSILFGPNLYFWSIFCQKLGLLSIMLCLNFGLLNSVCQKSNFDQKSNFLFKKIVLFPCRFCPTFFNWTKIRFLAEILIYVNKHPINRYDLLQRLYTVEKYRIRLQFILKIK